MIGAVKHSGTLSVSIFTKSEYAEEPFTFENWGDRFISPYISVEPTKITGYAKPHIEIEISGRAHPGGTFIVEDWRSFLKDHWIGMAFSRFFEIWNKGSLNDMMRGYLGKVRLQRSFSGKIGTNNGDLAHAKDKPLTKQADGSWTLKPSHKISYMYPRSRYLPPEGIENARKFAKELRQQRLAREKRSLQ